MAIDLLALQPNIITKDIRSKYIVLAGPPKIGKTEFITQCPKSLVLAFEKGTNGRPGAMVQPIQKWTEMRQVLRQLEKPEVKEKFEVIGIDTVNIAYELCEQYICNQHGVQKIGDIPYGGGYALLTKELEGAFRQITMLGYGLIFTTHLKEIADEDGKVVGYKPDMNNRCLKIVNGLVDIIGVITQSWNDKGESERWIQTRSTPTVTAGSRFKYLEPRIPFGYSEFVNALKKAIEREEELGAVVSEGPIETVYEVLDFKALHAEARALWEQILGKATNDEEQEAIYATVMKKIEMIFGRKIKLSEILEDQVDLLNLVVMEMRDMV